MGREWKKHKYIRKEGKRYFYKDDTTPTVEDLTGIESPDLQELGNELEKAFPVKKLREILDTPIYSPYKEDETLMTKASDLIKGKKKDKLLAKEEKKNAK